MDKPIEVRVFLSKEENEAYEAFLAPFTGKKGPYAKKLILERIGLKQEKTTAIPPSNQ